MLRPDRRRYRPPWTPEPQHLRHALAVGDLYVRMRQVERDGSCELVAFDAEPVCWRRFHGPGGAPAVLKPDAFAVTARDGFEEHVFVEVDRATEATTRITDKARVYVRYWQSGREQATHGVFPRVVWVAPDEQRVGQLVDALSRLPAEYWRLFAVTTDETAPQSITGSSSDVLGGSA